MSNLRLTTSFLGRLSNANHDGVSQQICDRLTAFVTNNQRLTTAIQAVSTCRHGEDDAYKNYSVKDFTSDDLKTQDRLGDRYMLTGQNVLKALLNLPETDPLRRKAQMALQVYKDFSFSTSNGYEAQARKVLNMYQQWQAATEYTLAELGIADIVTHGVAQANEVLRLIALRVEHESAKAKGELAAARKATDQAIREVYHLINALIVIDPTPELMALVSVLSSIESRAKLYYISSSSGSGSSGSATTPSNTGNTTNPTNTDTPNQGGGTTPSGGGSTPGGQGGDTPGGGSSGGGDNGGGSTGNGQGEDE